MKPLHIRAELLKRGYTVTAVGIELGLAQTTISNVIYGYNESPRVERHISALLGVPVERLWPNRYHNNTKRSAA